MGETKKVIIEVPETLMTQIELILQINGEDLDTVMIELLNQYKNECIHSAKKNQIIEEKVVLREDSAKIPITSQMIEISYEIAKKVYVGLYTVPEGKEKVHDLTGMSIGSAQDYINDFASMMEGEVYKRTMSAKATDYFLQQIYSDYGKEQFRIAVEAVKKHVKYYEQFSGSPSRKIVEVVDRLYDEFCSQEQELDEIEVKGLEAIRQVAPKTTQKHKRKGIFNGILKNF